MLCIQGISGQGVDRHLLGLRLIAQEAGMEIPDFFKDEAYSRSMYYRISTSQVSQGSKYSPTSIIRTPLATWKNQGFG